MEYWKKSWKRSLKVMEFEKLKRVRTLWEQTCYCCIIGCVWWEVRSWTKRKWPKLSLFSTKQMKLSLESFYPRTIWETEPVRKLRRDKRKTLPVSSFRALVDINTHGMFTRPSPSRVTGTSESTIVVGTIWMWITYIRELTLVGICR